MSLIGKEKEGERGGYVFRHFTKKSGGAYECCGGCGGVGLGFRVGLRRGKRRRGEASQTLRGGVRYLQGDSNTGKELLDLGKGTGKNKVPFKKFPNKQGVEQRRGTKDR